MTLVSEAMSRVVVAVPPEATAGDAAEVARAARAEHLVVLDAGNLVGVLCTCDLEGAERDELVAERMSLPVLTIRPDATLEDAADTMCECEVGCLPVACGGLLLGMLSEDELERAGVHAHRHRHRHHHRRDKMPHA
jgi:acetoin utilization protein AcuB